MATLYDDFYIVAPSHPTSHHRDNTCTKYSITWDGPIVFDPNDRWKVALTDMTYVYEPYTVFSHQGFHYKYIELKKFEFKDVRFHFEWNDLDKQTDLKIVFDGGHQHLKTTFPSLDMSLNDGYLHVNCEHSFTISMNSKDAYELSLTPHNNNNENEKFQTQAFPLGNDPNKFGILGVDQISYFDYNKSKQVYKMYTFNIIIHQAWLKSKIYYFPSDLIFHTGKELCEYIQTSCPEIFKKVDYWPPCNGLSDSTGMKKTHLTLGKKVVSVKMFGGINFVLGFEKELIQCAKDQEKHFLLAEYENDPYLKIADHQIQLSRGIPSFNVISNLCGEMRVGEKHMRMLRNVAVESSNNNLPTQLRVAKILRPMYVPVVTYKLKTLAIELVDDVGKVITLPDGVTTVTLHFKKTINRDDFNR